MRFFIVSLLFLLTCNASVDIDAKIDNTSRRLKNFDEKYRSLHVDMKRNAKEILRQNSAVLRQQKELAQLKKELVAKEKIYERQKAELEKMLTSQEKLDKAQNEIEQQLAFAIAKNASLSLLLEDDRVKDAESLIVQEALEQLAKQTQNRIKNLKESFSSNTDAIGKLQKRIKKLRSSILEIETKQNRLRLSLESNKKALKRLREKTESYQKALDKLLAQQKALKRKLAQLNIVKEEKIKKQKEEKRRAELAKKRAAEEEKLAKEQRDSMLVGAENLPKIKQVGSSYQRIRTKRYRGKKTIAPLDGYRVVKKYGPYTDPIYNIKIFNESVSLRPKKSNAKVKNILNGKVVLAEKMAMLDNVVIVEHANGLHTIYAQLDKIAPTIKKGKRIRKGSIIGRVSDELILEVTQKNYHINPLDLIR